MVRAAHGDRLYVLPLGDGTYGIVRPGIGRTNRTVIGVYTDHVRAIRLASAHNASRRIDWSQENAHAAN